jgi:hypothetical protein
VQEHSALIAAPAGTGVIAEISGGDTATRLDHVLACMRIQKNEFDDVTDTYGSLA